jgi:hypothetical protein
MKILKGILMTKLILFLFASSVYSADHWAITYSADIDNVPSGWVHQNNDGSFIVATNASNLGTIGRGMLISKIGEDGNIEWQKAYGGDVVGVGDVAEGVFSIIHTADEGYIAAGATSSFGSGDFDFWIVKLNVNGNIEWQKSYGDNGYDFGNSIIETSEGGFIVAGTSHIGDYKYWVLKLDSSGNVKWQKAYSVSNRENIAYTIKETLDGGYIIAGECRLAGRDAWLLKLTSDGLVEWSKTYGDVNMDRADDVYPTQDGGYIVAGTTGSFGAGAYDVWVLKLDQNGVIEWQKVYGGGNDDWAFSIIPYTNGDGYLLAGSTKSFGSGDDDFWLLRLDLDGTLAWQRTYGGIGSDTAASVQQTFNGGLAVAGTTAYLESAGIIVLNLDQNGLILNCNLIGESEAIVQITSVTGTSVSPIITTTTITPQVTPGVMQEIEPDASFLCHYFTDGDLLYNPVTPCRIVDTRNTSAGIIDANTERDFRVFGDGSTIISQGGNSAGCPAPMGEPLAAHINMIAVNPTGKGNLQAFPRDASTGTGLSVNYNTIDTNLANAGSIKAVAGAGPDITVASNFSSAHTVIDVLGSFYPEEGLLYTPVMPCRIVDTRYTSAGIIDVNTERNFRVFGTGGAIFAQGGDPDGCPSPLGEPLAAHINMVAVYPYGKGNLQAFPVGGETGAGLSVNYNILDTNLANAGSVKTNEGAGADITVASNFSSANTVIDVLGYYYPDGDFLYTPVKPCRIVDTRKTPAGMIDANTERNFRVFGSGTTISAQGGDPAGCSSPEGEPLAVHVNMVAVNPTGKGNLQAFPVGAGPGAGLSVNYNTIDTNLANAGTVKTDTGVGPEITVASNFSSAHTVIDVLGYYYPAP